MTVPMGTSRIDASSLIEKPSTTPSMRISRCSFERVSSADLISADAVIFSGSRTCTSSMLTASASSRRLLKSRFRAFTPEATLFSKSGKQLTTHFFSPNPDENGTIRAAWQHSRDTSAVWGRAFPGNASSDPAFVAPGAIPWLLVTVVGAEEGPGGGEALTDAKFIHCVNTAGGLAPSTGCSSAADVGRGAYVPYTTDYIFYRDAN